MLSIAFDARALGNQRTGDETYTRELLRQLIQDFPNNTYHLLFGKDASTTIPEKRNIHIHTITPEKKGIWTFWSMPKYLRVIEPDILHVQYTTPQWFSPKLKNTKIVTTIHDVAYKQNPKWITRKDRMLWNWFLPKSLKRADVIIAVSQNTKQDIIKYFHIPEQKIHVVYNGIEERYKKITDEKALQNVRQKYKLPKQFILYLGTLQPRKNIPTLIKAYDTFKQQTNTHVALVIGGKRYGHNYDPAIDSAISSVKYSKDIHFPGYIDEEDKPTLYTLANLFVWPSLYEGFGLPPLEAKACGTPVLVSNTSSHPEIIKNKNELFEPTIETLISKLTRYYQSTPSNIPSPHVPTFSWHKAAQETMKIYQAITTQDS